MHLKKPVIVSNCRPLKRVVKETESGLFFQADNPEDLARNILFLFNNKQMRSQMGKNAKNAVLKKYNWNKGKEWLWKNNFIKRDYRLITQS